MMNNEWYCFGALRSDEVTPQVMREVLDQARSLKPRIARVPVLAILDVLHEAGRRLGDPAHPIRRKALAELPGRIHFSPAMVEVGLETLSDILDRNHLKTQLVCDLGGPMDLLDDFTWHDRFQGYFRAMPQGVLAHVSAGNVFVGAADSLVRGLLTKNVNLLKTSSSDPIFPVLFARLLVECDFTGDIAACLATVPFAGGDREVEGLVKSECDAIMLYGGEEAVRAYRDGLGLHTRLLEYGPKYSCVLLEAAELSQRGLAPVAMDVARDFTIWNQSACSSPHVVFIDDDNLAHEFAHELGRQLAGWVKLYPHDDIPYQEQVEITRSRELARVEQALGQGEVIVPSVECQDWTVIFDRAPKFRVSCQHRTAYVKPVAHFDEAIAMLAGYGRFIQSVGLLTSYATRFSLAGRLVAAGADRITEIGWMTRRKHGSSHDGGKGLSELVRWVSLGHRTPFHDPFDYLPDIERDRVTLTRVNHLLAVARERSPFLRDRVPTRPLASLAELASIPLMSGEDLRAHLPPTGHGLLTDRLEGAYAFSSSGTTGEPKAVYRTVEETLHNARALAKGLALSILLPGDVVADLLFAGHMWASFVSYNQALERCGALILPIGGHIPLDVMAGYLRCYRPTAAISIPSVILSLARWAEDHGVTDLHIPKLITGGEHLFPEGRAYLTRVLGVERFASTGYTTNDTGAIGWQCAHCDGGVHHVHEDIQYAELLDQTGQPVPEGQPGKVVVTCIARTLMPLIRYEVGDMARWISGPCACGRSVRRMELLGRSDESLRVGSNLVSLEAVARVVGRVAGLSQAFRMRAEREGMLDTFYVEVEASAPSARLEAALMDSLRIEMEDVVKEMTDPALGRLVLRILPIDALPRNPRTGKIRQVVDERSYDLPRVLAERR